MRYGLQRCSFRMPRTPTDKDMFLEKGVATKVVLSISLRSSWKESRYIATCFDLMVARWNGSIDWRIHIIMQRSQAQPVACQIVKESESFGSTACNIIKSISRWFYLSCNLVRAVVSYARSSTFGKSAELIGTSSVGSNSSSMTNRIRRIERRDQPTSQFTAK